MRSAFLLTLLLSVAVRAAETIPDISSVDDLRAAPLWTLADGTQVRVGLSDGGPAAGPWIVLYCLVEDEATTRPTTAPAPEPAYPGHLELLGPLRYGCDWGGCPKMLQDQMRMGRMKHLKPPTYAGPVALERVGAMRLSVIAPGGSLLAERQFRVEHVRPRWWTQFARAQQRSRDEPVVADAPFPAMPSFGYAGATIGEGKTLPGDVADDRAEKSPLRLSLDGNSFILRSDDGKPSLYGEQDENALARWWVNGKPIAIPEDAIPRVLQRQQAWQRMRGGSTELRIAFGLPDFLGKLNRGDRVGVQVLWCPNGHKPLLRMQTASHDGPLRMQHANARWNWPVLSNRIEFQLTDERLADRDHPIEQ
jgi:hypothetical protein